MCILSVIAGGLLITTSGCYAGVEVIEPDYVVYDSQVEYYYEPYVVLEWSPRYRRYVKRHRYRYKRNPRYRHHRRYRGKPHLKRAYPRYKKKHPRYKKKRRRR